MSSLRETIAALVIIGRRDGGGKVHPMYFPPANLARAKNGALRGFEGALAA